MDRLFTSYDLDDFLDWQLRQATEALDRAQPADEAAVAEVASSFQVEPLRVSTEITRTAPEPVQILVADDLGEGELPGRRFTVSVSFEGDPRLFECSTGLYCRQRATVHDDRLSVGVEVLVQDLNATLGERLQGDFKEIARDATFQGRAVQAWNDGLEERLREHRAMRAEEQDAADQGFDALGFPEA